MEANEWTAGSTWLRWDPHIHAPGTLRNDQFGDVWTEYFKAIEQARPAAVVLGITDYFTLRTYKKFCERRGPGVLAAVLLVFPNVELRLTIETERRQGINIHLLVDPSTPNHVTRIEEKLASLLFSYRGERFPCNEEGLRRLGRLHSGSGEALSDDKALSEGVNQFKVDFNSLRELFGSDSWMRENVLVAVAAGSDGLSGIKNDASFSAQREELARFAHLIFSGNPSDRRFWLGDDAGFVAKHQSPKPCLHGSDAHRLDEVLEPTQQRRCWLRAAPTFEGLRQTLVEPARRVHIGEAPPDGPPQHELIRYVRVLDAAWLAQSEFELNEGLVTVIGAKGSGKTAFAELIALGADAADENPGGASFLAKAGSHLSGLTVELEWGDQSTTTGGYDNWQRGDDRGEPRVRYLSQQFVEHLCTAHGPADLLMLEIERVVFDAIPTESRLQCSSFDELRRLLLEDVTAQRHLLKESIRTETATIAREHQLIGSLTGFRGKVAESERNRMGVEKAIASIPVKVSDEKVKAQQAATQAVQELREAVAREELRAQHVRDLSAEVQRQKRSLDAWHSQTRGKYLEAIGENDWESLRFTLPETAEARLLQLSKMAVNRAQDLRLNGLPNNSPTAETSSGGLEALTKRSELLTQQLGVDQGNVKRRSELAKKVHDAKQQEDRARKQLAHAEGAAQRLGSARIERLTNYLQVFDALEAEENTLARLYEPLHGRIAKDSRLDKLSFVVKRIVDLDGWVGRGELIFDLRTPPFQGKGALYGAARKSLLRAWESDTAENVRDAMERFIEDHLTKSPKLAAGVTHQQLGDWLFSTDHISVRYQIQYEGVEIANLSPGTKGVVLLTLYLALDESDSRPLVIDQPEENLDPRSVYTDLVPFFRTAAIRRQIIMVTHNANLVVNTDSDQVVVAQAQRKLPSQLPEVRYYAGGLESARIRRDVCQILEGGEDAFRKRGLRYGGGAGRREHP